jgi:hypothetical protein
MHTLRSIIASLGLLAALPACVNDSDAPDMVDPQATEEDVPAALADITVTTGYGGNQRGALVVGAFRSIPPMGPPLAFQTVAMPTFPAVVTLRDVEPGTAFVIAVLDRAPADPTRPGMEDLQAASGPLMLDGADASVSLSLIDP